MSDREHPFWKVVSGESPAPPAAKLLGWKPLEAEPDSGRIRVQFTAGQEFTNPQGNVQGGFLGAMLDDTMGAAVATTLASGEFCPTIEMKVNFLRQASPGSFIGEGRVVHRGGSIAFLEGTLSSSEGKVLATATCTVRIVRAQSPS
jgi:uncharacterized protein (TIGR00369 family)